MSSLDQMPIPQLYREVNHITSYGIPGYAITNKYVDPVEMMKSREL